MGLFDVVAIALVNGLCWAVAVKTDLAWIKRSLRHAEDRIDRIQEILQLRNTR